MRIAAITTSYPKHPGDGTAPFIRAISHGIARLGASVNLVLPWHRELQWRDADGPVRLHPYRYAPPWRALERWGYAEGLAADRKLHVGAKLVAPLAAVAGSRRLAGVAVDRAANVLHAHWVVPNGVLAARVARKRRLPLVVSLHGSDVFLAERTAWLHGPTRRALRLAAAVTACSRDLAGRAVSLGAPEDRVHVVPYGVDLQAFRPADAAARAQARRASSIETDRPVVLAVGRLVAKKGFDVLIEAFARLRRGDGPVLVLAGDGDLRTELRALADRHRVDVRMLGSVDRTTLARLYAAADVLAVPSVIDDAGNVDGLPNVALEGMASGLAIAASRVAGIPDVMTDDENARLVEPGRAEALAGALDSLLSSPADRARLGTAARAYAEQHLGWDTTCARYFEILEGAARG